MRPLTCYCAPLRVLHWVVTCRRSPLLCVGSIAFIVWGEGEGACVGVGVGKGARVGVSEGACVGVGEGVRFGEGKGVCVGEGKGAHVGEGEGKGVWHVGEGERVCAHACAHW